MTVGKVISFFLEFTNSAVLFALGVITYIGSFFIAMLIYVYCCPSATIPSTALRENQDLASVH